MKTKNFFSGPIHQLLIFRRFMCGWSISSRVFSEGMKICVRGEYKFKLQVQDIHASKYQYSIQHLPISVRHQPFHCNGYRVA